jgi:uncharacterized protein with GYD domain
VLAFLFLIRIKVKDIYWTVGQYDAVLIADAPDAEAVMSWAFVTGSLGNIRTETMRAFPAEDMHRILAKIP